MTEFWGFVISRRTSQCSSTSNNLKKWSKETSQGKGLKKEESCFFFLIICSSPNSNFLISVFHLPSHFLDSFDNFSLWVLFFCYLFFIFEKQKENSMFVIWAQRAYLDLISNFASSIFCQRFWRRKEPQPLRKGPWQLRDKYFLQ